MSVQPEPKFPNYALLALYRALCDWPEELTTEDAANQSGSQDKNDDAPAALSSPAPGRFLEGETESVRSAIRRAEEDMNEWQERASVSPEQMQQPLTTPKQGENE